MKLRVIHFTTTAFITLAVVIGCASRPVGEPQSLWEQFQSFVSDFAIQVLVELKGDGGISDGLTHYLSKFSDNNLRWITAELEATAQKARAQGIKIDDPVTLTSAQRAEAETIIADAEARFFNKYGWMSLAPNGPTAEYDNENPTFFTAQYFWLLNRLGLFDEAFKSRWLTRLKNQIKEMELQPGLYDRFAKPRWAEVNPFSHDENQGLAHLDSLFGFQIGVAKLQYEYGIKYDYVYMNQAWSAPDKFDRPIVWHGRTVSKAEALVKAQRYGGQVEVIRRTGGGAPSSGSDLLLCADLLTSLREPCDQTSTPILNLLRIGFLQGQTDALDGCFLVFKDLFRKHYAVGKTCDSRPVTCNNAYCAATEIYFRDPQHPIRRLVRFLPEGAW